MRIIEIMAREDASETICWADTMYDIDPYYNINFGRESCSSCAKVTMVAVESCTLALSCWCTGCWAGHYGRDSDGVFPQKHTSDLPMQGLYDDEHHDHAHIHQWSTIQILVHSAWSLRQSLEVIFCRHASASRQTTGWAQENALYEVDGQWRTIMSVKQNGNAHKMHGATCRVYVNAPVVCNAVVNGTIVQLYVLQLGTNVIVPLCFLQFLNSWNKINCLERILSSKAPELSRSKRTLVDLLIILLVRTKLDASTRWGPDIPWLAARDLDNMHNTVLQWSHVSGRTKVSILKNYVHNTSRNILEITVC